MLFDKFADLGAELAAFRRTVGDVPFGLPFDAILSPTEAVVGGAARPGPRIEQLSRPDA